jgi:hypothetical protein
MGKPLGRDRFIRWIASGISIRAGPGLPEIANLIAPDLGGYESED